MELTDFEKLQTLLHTFEPTNIDLALQLADSQKLPLRTYWEDLQKRVEQLRKLGAIPRATKNEAVWASLARRQLTIEQPAAYDWEDNDKLIQALPLLRPLESLIAELTIVAHSELVVPETIVYFEHLHGLTLDFRRALQLPHTIEAMHTIKNLTLVTIELHNEEEFYDEDEMVEYFPPCIETFVCKGDIKAEYINMFLTAMPTVQTVVLDGNQSELPDALQALSNLRTLHLLDCSHHLVRASLLKLKDLRELSLVGTWDEIENPAMQTKILTRLQNELPHTRLILQ